MYLLLHRYSKKEVTLLSVQTVESSCSLDITRPIYAPNFEKVDGAYCFWSVRGYVRGWVRAWVTLFVPTVTFKPLKLES